LKERNKFFFVGNWGVFGKRIKSNKILLARVRNPYAQLKIYFMRKERKKEIIPVPSFIVKYKDPNLPKKICDVLVKHCRIIKIVSQELEVFKDFPKEYENKVIILRESKAVVQVLSEILTT